MLLSLFLQYNSLRIIYFQQQFFLSVAGCIALSWARTNNGISCPVTRCAHLFCSEKCRHLFPRCIQMFCFELVEFKCFVLFCCMETLVLVLFKCFFFVLRNVDTCFRVIFKCSFLFCFGVWKHQFCVVIKCYFSFCFGIWKHLFPCCF